MATTRRPWTEAEDIILLDMRRQGATWPEITARLDRPGATASARLSRIAPGVTVAPEAGRSTRRQRRVGGGEEQQVEDHVGPAQRGFDPMRAFHPVSWGAIWLPSQLPAGEVTGRDPAEWTGKGRDGL